MRSIPHGAFSFSLSSIKAKRIRLADLGQICLLQNDAVRERPPYPMKKQRHISLN